VATSVYLIVGGVLYEMNDGAPFFVTAWDGLGLLPVNRLSQRGALQHGDTDTGWRGQPRFFSVTFGINRGCSIADRIAARRTLLQRIAPRNDALALRFVFDVGETTERIYQIDARSIAEPGAVEARDVHGLTLVPVRFKASDPTFYDPAVIVATWALAISNDLILPFELPFILGTNIINDTLDVAYTGDLDDYPIIRFRGPLIEPQIENVTTGDIIGFRSGASIAVDEQVTIDLRYGNKTVTSNLGGVSRLGDIDPNRDDLARFSLAAALDGSGARVNTFRVIATGALEGASAATLTYNTRYSGI